MHIIVHLRSAVLSASQVAHTLSASEVVALLETDINSHVETPLAHALCLAEGYFNELLL